MKKKVNGRSREEQALWQELRGYKQEGWMICLNGEPSQPGRIVSACLREKGNYMRDFISDDQTQVKKIDFIQLKKDR